MLLQRQPMVRQDDLSSLEDNILSFQHEKAKWCHGRKTRLFLAQPRYGVKKPDSEDATMLTIRNSEILPPWVALSSFL